MMSYKKDETSGIVVCFGVIGLIVGTILFVTNVFGEWYAEFNVEPVRLITGILTLIVWLLPFAISLILGGGIGFIVGAVIATIGIMLNTTIISYVSNTYKKISKTLWIKKETVKLKKERKKIDKVIMIKTNIIKKGIGKRKEISNVKCLITLLNELSTDASMQEIKIVIDDKMNAFNEIDSINQRIRNLAERYEAIGNRKLADYYLVQARIEE